MTASPLRPSRRAFLRTGLGALAVGALASSVPELVSPAFAGSPYVLKPLPAAKFIDFKTNAEMRWESVDHSAYLTQQADLFVRDHISTPTIDARTYRLSVFGGAVSNPRDFSLDELKALPHTTLVSVHECTGNGRSFFGTQQQKAAPGTQWTLGAVSTVQWTGVKLSEVLDLVGVSGHARSVMAAGLDAEFQTYGHVRRPFPIDKALDDALLAWDADGEALLPDHGYPLRLVLPGWVGIGSIKWLGSLQVEEKDQECYWNTIAYRMTGGAYPPDSPPLTVNPVRSAWELSWNAQLAASPGLTLTGRSWSGAAPIRKVEVSLDGGRSWRPARLEDRGNGPGAGNPGGDVEGFGWTRWSIRWPQARAGRYELLARATDTLGRTQPDVTPYNDNGYFFDAVVRHPVTVG